MRSGFIYLVLSNLRMHLRNRSSLFWHFAFPLIFMVLFGLIFQQGGGSVSIGFSSEQPVYTSAFRAAFKEADGVEVSYGPKSRLMRELKAGELDTVVYLGTRNTRGGTTPVEIYYDPSESFTSEIARGVVSSVLDGIARSASKTPPLFDVDEESVVTAQLGFISFLMPGIIGMSIMFSSLFSTAGALVMEREKGILRRFRLTLIKPFSFLAAKSVGLVIISFMQAAIIIAVATAAFDVKIVGNLLSAMLVVLIGCLSFVALGLLIAGLSKRMESVDAVANAVSMPMMFLAGTFFPIDQAPAWLALRDILVHGKGLADVRVELLVLLAWTIALLVVSARLFKWEAHADGASP